MIDVSIDVASCARTGYCARVAPDRFRLGPESAEFDASTALDEDRDLESLFEAESLCPMGAIQVQVRTDDPC